MDLRSLIDSLKKSSKEGRLDIPNIHKILEKLEEMDAMIEMEDVKSSFVSQLLLILLMRMKGFVPPFRKMHTVFSGPPGVGKTCMSILVAQVWSYLNIMDKSFALDNIKSSKILHKINEDSLDELTPLTSDIKVKYKKDISCIMVKIQDKIQDMMLSLDMEYENRKEEEVPEFIKDMYSKINTSSDLCDTIIDKYSKHFKELDEDLLTRSSHKSIDVDPYIVLGRGDFVGSHVGETSIKSAELLRKHKGKIIILEEAYLFHTDERDSFGMEALTLINRYMDERSDDYIFIFNGYEDILNRTIFKAQPGLKRRIQWTFNIQKYSPDGIFKIFKHQLLSYSNPDWKIIPEDESFIRKLFLKHKDDFPYFGGDTEKLILQCQLEYGSVHFHDVDAHLEKDCIITKDIFIKSLENFHKNIKGEIEDKIKHSGMYI